MLLADYPFSGVLWSMLVFFLWVAWFMLLFHIIGDVFRRRDASGLNKTLWLIFILFVPFLGTFVYLIANSDDMARRNVEQMEAARSETDSYIRSVATPARRPRSSGPRPCSTPERSARPSTTRSRPRPSRRREGASCSCLDRDALGERRDPDDRAHEDEAPDRDHRLPWAEGSELRAHPGEEERDCEEDDA